MSCPSDKTVCLQQKTTNLAGWLTFTAILAIFLLQDFIPGALIFYESSIDFDFKGLFAGLTLLNITILSTIASTIFIYATSISNIAIIKDAVIVLFLNSIDEQMFMIIQRIAPDWVDDVEAEIMNATLDKITQEISEVEDDYSDYAPSQDKDGDSGNMFEKGGGYDNGYSGFDDENGDYNGYEDYGNGYDDYAANDTKKAVPDVNLDEVKQDLISEIMAVYDADKAQFMKVHEVEKAQIRNELKQVKEENRKLKAAFLAQDHAMS